MSPAPRRRALAARDRIAALRDEVLATLLVARGFSHCVKNHLAVASLCVDVGLGSDDAGPAREALEQLRDANGAARAAADGYARFAAGVMPAPGSGVDLACTAAFALDLLASVLEGAEVAVTRRLEPSPAAAESGGVLTLGLVLLANLALLERDGGRRLEVATRLAGDAAVLRLEARGAPEMLEGALGRSLSDGAAEGRLATLALAGARAIAARAGGELSASERGGLVAIEARFPARPSRERDGSRGLRPRGRRSS